MPGENQDPIDVAAITKSVIEQATASLTKTLTESITKQVREEVAADLGKLRTEVNTVANTLKDSPPANADGIKKLVNEAIAAERATAKEAGDKQAARAALIEKITTEKLGGNKKLAELLTGDDEGALNASADKVIETAKTLKPDFGSTAGDGGRSAVAGADGGKPASTLKWSA